MSISAIQSAGDAIDVTREYLFGRSLRQVLTLAFMVLFLGPTGTSAPPGPVELDETVFDADDGLPSPGDIIAAIDWELAMIVIVLIGVFAVLYGLVSAFMEFGFVHSLVVDTAAIREPAQDHWPRALSLFLFRAVVWGLGAVTIALLIAGALDLVDLPRGVDLISIWPLLVLAGGSVYLVNRFTTDFVVPIMYHERRGLISGWRRLVGVIRDEWRQFAVYVPVRIMLEVALGIAFGIVISVAILALGVIIGIPVGVILVLVVGTTTGLVVTVGILSLLAIALVAAAMIPFHTYLRYYTLLVLGDASHPLDLIADKRHRARSTAR